MFSNLSAFGILFGALEVEKKEKTWAGPLRTMKPK
jgi:hypothetical protein